MKRLACCALLPFVLGQLDARAAGRGNEGSGGGDLCEARFQSVALDLRSWIEAGGATGLELRSGNQAIPLEQYTNAMKNALSSYQVTCVGPGDPGHPVLVDGQAKECRSFRAADGSGRVICDRTKFYSGLPSPDNDPDQYRIVHHEFATLAGLEVPRGADSQYWLSDQITGFLSRQTVLKLAVKPKLKNDPKLGDFTITTDPTDFNFALSPDRTHLAFKSLDGLIVRDLVSARNVLTLGDKAEPAVHLQYSPSGDTLCAFRDHSSKGSRVSCFDTSTGRERFELRGVGDLVFPRTGTTFISVTSGGSAQVRQLADGHLIREIQVTGLPKSFAFLRQSTISPDGRRLAVMVIDDSRENNEQKFIRRLYALDLASGKTLFSRVGAHPAFRADGRLIALAVRPDEYGSEYGGALLIDSETGREIASNSSLFALSPEYLGFLRDGRLLVSYGTAATQILSGESYDHELALPGISLFSLQVHEHLDPEESFYLADLGTGLNLAVFDLRTGRILSTIATKEHSLFSSVLSPDRVLSVTEIKPSQEFNVSVLEIPSR